ncbi:MAG TPA: pilus assembly protein PilM, partial [Jatrophihabitantaceae bacterium]|nr:pilus assembly protein PilM [Jatrophihabitantaceae bacterium]
LRQLWNGQRLKNRNVVVGVTNPQVIVREVVVTNLPPREMKQSLPYQVRDVLPIPVDEALLDFYPLEDPGKNETVHGLLIAAPKDGILTTVRAVEAAGLHVTRVDLASFAALRAAAHMGSEVEAIVDIGSRMTNIVVHVDGEPQIVRTVPRGGADITAMIATRLGASTAEAEALKCRIGLYPLGGQDTADVVAEAVGPLINEIRSSLDYYTSAKSGASVSRVALVGGGSLLPGLIERLANQLGVEAFLADPLARVSGSRRGGRHDILGRFRSSAAVSIGLTLGAA